MLAYSDTLTHKRLESSSQLTSPTRTCLDFFPSPPYPSDDVFATSGGTRYIHGYRDAMDAGERDGESYRGEKGCLRWQSDWGGKRQNKWGREGERSPNQGGRRGTNSSAYTPSVASNLNPQQKAWVPPSGRPVANWAIFGVVLGGVALGRYESIRVRGQPSWVAVTSWQ